MAQFVSQCQYASNEWGNHTYPLVVFLCENLATSSLSIGTLRYPGRGGKENGESLERGCRHLREKNKLRLSRLGGVLA